MNLINVIGISIGVFFAGMAFAVIALIVYVGRGESDVNGDPERDAGALPASVWNRIRGIAPAPWPPTPRPDKPKRHGVCHWGFCGLPGTRMDKYGMRYCDEHFALGQAAYGFEPFPPVSSL